MRITVLTVVAALALGALPQPARAESKVGFVDLQRALNSVDEGKSAKEALKREFEQKQKLLDDKKAEFDRLRQDFEKQQAIMSDDARKQKQGELERKGMDLQGTFVQLQKELSEREREATRGIFDKMHALVREIAAQDGVNLVVSAEALIYADPSLDLTDELIRKYNARHKPGVAAAAAKSDKKATARKEGK